MLHNIRDAGDISGLAGQGHQVIAVNVLKCELPGSGHELLQPLMHPVDVGVHADGSRRKFGKIAAEALFELGAYGKEPLVSFFYVFAFKLHRGKLPVLEGKDWLIPIVVEEFFADGDIDKAVREAAEAMYGEHDAAFDWVETIRYMGLFHEVVPGKAALECLDCHGGNGRMNWKELGYEGDPLVALLPAE